MATGTLYPTISSPEWRVCSSPIFGNSEICAEFPCEHTCIKDPEFLADLEDSIARPEFWNRLWDIFRSPAKVKQNLSPEEFDQYHRLFPRCHLLSSRTMVGKVKRTLEEYSDWCHWYFMRYIYVLNNYIDEDGWDFEDYDEIRDPEEEARLVRLIEERDEDVGCPFNLDRFRQRIAKSGGAESCAEWFFRCRNKSRLMRLWAGGVTDEHIQWGKEALLRHNPGYYELLCGRHEKKDVR
jgi:hypothetical protein